MEIVGRQSASNLNINDATSIQDRETFLENQAIKRETRKLQRAQLDKKLKKKRAKTATKRKKKKYQKQVKETQKLQKKQEERAAKIQKEKELEAQEILKKKEKELEEQQKQQRVENKKVKKALTTSKQERVPEAPKQSDFLNLSLSPTLQAAKKAPEQVEKGIDLLTSPAYNEFNEEIQKYTGKSMLGLLQETSNLATKGVSKSIGTVLKPLSMLRSGDSEETYGEDRIVGDPEDPKKEREAEKLDEDFKTKSVALLEEIAANTKNISKDGDEIVDTIESEFGKSRMTQMLTSVVSSATGALTGLLGGALKGGGLLAGGALAIKVGADFVNKLNEHFGDPLQKVADAVMLGLINPKEAARRAGEYFSEVPTRTEKHIEAEEFTRAQVQQEALRQQGIPLDESGKPVTPVYTFPEGTSFPSVERVTVSDPETPSINNNNSGGGNLIDASTNINAPIMTNQGNVSGRRYIVTPELEMAGN